MSVGFHGYGHPIALGVRIVVHVMLSKDLIDIALLAQIQRPVWPIAGDAHPKVLAAWAQIRYLKALVEPALQVGDSLFVGSYYQDVIHIHSNDGVSVRVQEHAVVLIDVTVAELVEEFGQELVPNP